MFIKKFILLFIIALFSLIIIGCGQRAIENKDIKIDNIVSKPDSIAFKVSKLNQSVNIETVTLLEDDKIIYYLYEDFDPSRIYFTNLKRNTNYTIKVEYKNSTLKTFSISVKTVETKKPTIKLDVFNITSQGFEFRIVIIDNTTVGEIKSIEVFIDELLIDRFENNIEDFDIEFNSALSEYTITGKYSGLKTNEDYLLKITYEYDLFDGRGVKSTNESIKFKTL